MHILSRSGAISGVNFAPYEIIEVWSGALTRAAHGRRVLGPSARYVPAQVLEVDPHGRQVFVAGIDEGMGLGLRWIPMSMVRKCSGARGLELNPDLDLESDPEWYG